VTILESKHPFPVYSKHFLTVQHSRPVLAKNGTVQVKLTSKIAG